ncbi:DUF5667 domain-containing protein [Streptomyces sp. NPDC002764]|uniref:DUF5667 domain-containing protein n=1 Tax=unclassified Streptomyces TaxID=2593676 RepID=UPI0033282609
MTDRKHDAESHSAVNPEITDRFAVAAAYADEQLPLLTAEGRNAMLARVLESAPRQSSPAEPTVTAVPVAGSAPLRRQRLAAGSSRGTAAVAVQRRPPRTNAFAAALEGLEDAEIQAEGPHPEPTADSGEQARLLGLTEALAHMPKPELDPEVKIVQRARLVAAMEAMLAEGTDPLAVPPQRSRPTRSGHRALRPRSRWSRRLATAGLALGVAVGSFAGMASASTNALPGDALYGMKRGIEDVQLSWARDDTQRADLYLGQASTRLREVELLVARENAAAADARYTAHLRVAVTDLRDDASQGLRLLLVTSSDEAETRAMLATLADFSQDNRRSWNVVREQLPPALTDESAQVTALFDTIDRDVTGANVPPTTANPEPESAPGRPGRADAPAEGSRNRGSQG